MLAPVLAAAALAAGLAGCADSGTTAGDGTTSSTVSGDSSTTTVDATASTASSTTSASDAQAAQYAWVYTEPDRMPITTLVDPGAEPHEVRAYQPAIGLAETASLTTTTDLSQTLDGAENRISNAVVITTTGAVLDVTDEGVVISTTFDSVEATAEDPTIQASLDATYADLVGVTVNQLMAPSGALLATESLESIPGSELLTGGVSGGLSPLPDEPFGVGAVWETVGSIEANGIVFVQTSTVTVTAIDGPLISVDIDVRQELGPDGLSAVPGLGAAEVDAVVETLGTGQAVWNLEGIVPVNAASDTTQTLDATITADGQTGTLEQVLKATSMMIRQ
jgi:hypothetical protein